MTLSHHANKRCQQRGITPDLILVLEALGMEICQKGNSYVLQLDKKTQRSLSKRLKSLFMQVQKNIFVVISDDETVITAAHKH
ncbi:hypothetical protein [Alteromonas sp. AMM-1]|uniref:hypothetical protein n=1 Tax=Alteromonas sp. AMM-1 TaxID=3394233 RepID=UPI0039A5DAF3